MTADNGLPEDFVRVPESEYKEMQRRLRKLDALEAGGVDNWEWYEASLEKMEEEEE